MDVSDRLNDPSKLFTLGSIVALGIFLYLAQMLMDISNDKGVDVKHIIASNSPADITYKLCPKAPGMVQLKYLDDNNRQQVTKCIPFKTEYGKYQLVRNF